MPSGLPAIVKLTAFCETSGVELGVAGAQKVTRGLKGLIGSRNNFCSGRQVWTKKPRLKLVSEEALEIKNEEMRTLEAEARQSLRKYWSERAGATQ